HADVAGDRRLFESELEHGVGGVGALALDVAPLRVAGVARRVGAGVAAQVVRIGRSVDRLVAAGEAQRGGQARGEEGAGDVRVAAVEVRERGQVHQVQGRAGAEVEAGQRLVAGQRPPL